MYDMINHENDERLIDGGTFSRFIKDYWRTEELQNLLIEFEDELETASQSTKDTDAYRMIVLRIMARSLITTREIIILCETGYSDGAFSLARNLYEQLIHIFFFMIHENDPDFNHYVEDYYLNGQYQIIKYNKESARCFSDNKELARQQKEEETIRKQAHHTFPQKKQNDYWWAGKDSFYGLVKDVKEKYPDSNSQKILDRLHLYYTATNRSIHANSAGNSQRLGNKYQSHIIDTAPNGIGQGFPLHFATLCLCVIMARVCQMFGMRVEHFNSELNRLAVYYSEKIAENA